MGQILRNGCGVRAALVAAAGLATAMHAGASPLFTTIALSNTDGALGPGMGSGVAFTSAVNAALKKARDVAAAAQAEMQQRQIQSMLGGMGMGGGLGDLGKMLGGM